MCDSARLLTTTARELDALLDEVVLHLEDRLSVRETGEDRALLEAVETWRLSTR